MYGPASHFGSRLSECEGHCLQEKKPLIGFAMGAGVCIFFGNLGLQLALTLCGVTIAVPLFSSFLVIIGGLSFTALVGFGINILLANGWCKTVRLAKYPVAFGGGSPSEDQVTSAVQRFRSYQMAGHLLSTEGSCESQLLHRHHQWVVSHDLMGLAVVCTGSFKMAGPL